MSPASSSTFPARELFSYSLPRELRSAVSEAHREWDAAKKTTRLWAKDTSLWTNLHDDDSLAWLDLGDRQLQDLSKFKALSAEVREDGFSQVVVLSAEGCCLPPTVSPGFSPRQNGCLDLILLDSIDPSRVREVRSSIDPSRTLFCVSSRSGSTGTELLARYFFGETARLAGDGARQHFLAIGGPNALSGELTAGIKFRHVFATETNLRMPYSAFSDFGLVPYAAAGGSAEKLLKGVKRAAELSKISHSSENPGVSLGLLLSTAAAGFRRNKVTLICSRSMRAFGQWAGHLLADSMGEARGFVPVFGEAESDSETYGPDRVFVYLKYGYDHDKDIEKHVSELEQGGHAVVRLVLEEANDAGQLIFEWQIAAAVASSILEVNPFRTREENRLSLSFDESEALCTEAPLVAQGELKLLADPSNAEAVMRMGETAGGLIRRHLDRLNPGDCFALLALVPALPEYAEVLQSMRKRVLESKQAATLLGFGPAASNAAGTTCLAGRDAAVVLFITCEDAEDLPIPDKPYTFGAVKAAQARRDFQLLSQRNRRMLHIHLGADVAKGLHQLHDLVCAAIEH